MDGIRKKTVQGDDERNRGVKKRRRMKIDERIIIRCVLKEEEKEQGKRETLMYTKRRGMGTSVKVKEGKEEL